MRQKHGKGLRPKRQRKRFKRKSGWSSPFIYSDRNDPSLGFGRTSPRSQLISILSALGFNQLKKGLF